MTSLMLVGVCAMMTFVGAKSTYFIWKVLAGITWWGLGVWWIYSPFTTAGTPPHGIMVEVVFVAGIACFFWSFWESKFNKSGRESGGSGYLLPPQSPALMMKIQNMLP